jgi:hypothetical protein
MLARSDDTPESAKNEWPRGVERIISNNFLLLDLQLTIPFFFARIYK